MTPRSRRDGAGGVLLLLLLAGHMLAAAAADSGAAHAGGDADGAALDSSEWAVVTFPDVGTNIKDLPGADILHPKKHVTDIRLALAPALIEGPTGGNGDLLRFYNTLFRDDNTGDTFLFGPTLRAKAGDRLTLGIKNEMIQGPDKHASGGGFYHPMDTNLHTHGLHVSPGTMDQAVPVKYTQGDNVLITAPARHSADEEPASLKYTIDIPEYHLPGLHWSHPHHHGGTTLQTTTASFFIIVEDDPRWLPSSGGCKPVREAISEAEEVLLHLEVMIFGAPRPPYPGANARITDANIQVYSALSTPTNRLCCGTEGEPDANSLKLTGSMSGMDFVLVNGGWQPVLDMTAGKWQRWRMLHSGIKRFLTLTVVEEGTFIRAKDCEVMLLAKDGVYPMKIPRTVDEVFITSGGRAEVLVRCDRPGTYTLTSHLDAQFPLGRNFTESNWLQQNVILTLNVQEAPKGSDFDPRLASKACIPLRPAYAADLRDKALAAAGAADKVLTSNVSFLGAATLAQNFGCLVNGANFTYPDPEPLVLPIGSVVHWDFTGMIGHPFHMHVVPFQIQALPLDALQPGMRYSNYFEVGDWHDTLNLPQTRSNASIPLRMNPYEISGYSVMHCHFLQHEDMGCMKMVKFECPGSDDPQPITCKAEPAVQGTMPMDDRKKMRRSGRRLSMQ